MKKIIATTLLSLSLFGCSSLVTIPEVVPVPILPIPKLPVLTPKQIGDIKRKTYDILVKREIILKAHINRINAIIKAHNKEGKMKRGENK